jgi:(p)ppGpp synthase/HD superfamily hydrolase
MTLSQIQTNYFAAISALPEETRDTLRFAYELAEKEHSGQLRKLHRNRTERDPYLIHPLRVSLILMHELRLRDRTSLASAVLHDVIEDGVSRPTVENLESKFGEEIASTVDYLSKPEGAAGVDSKELHQYHESFFSAPLHVRMVKLADRLDNMRETLLVDIPRFQNRYLKETREIYLPLAEITNAYYCEQLEMLCSELESLLNKS